MSHLILQLHYSFFLVTSLQLLDIRDKTSHAIKNMSDQSVFNNENEIGKEKTEITVELIEEKDIPEVLDLLKEFFFKVRECSSYCQRLRLRALWNV